MADDFASIPTLDEVREERTSLLEPVRADDWELDELEERERG